MYEYTDKEDGTKACTTECKANDYASALRKITNTEYNNPKDGIAPYTVKRKAPSVSLFSLVYFAIAEMQSWFTNYSLLVQLLQVVEGWLPTVDDERSDEVEGDKSASYSSDDDDEDDDDDDDAMEVA